MVNDTDSSTNRRNLLKTISTGALATTLFGGVASADYTTPDDAGLAAEDCNTFYEHRCVSSECDCADSGCICQTIKEFRECCMTDSGKICDTFWWYDGCCTSC